MFALANSVDPDEKSTSQLGHNYLGIVTGRPDFVDSSLHSLVSEA